MTGCTNWSVAHLIIRFQGIYNHYIKFSSSSSNYQLTSITFGAKINLALWLEITFNLTGCFRESGAHLIIRLHTNTLHETQLRSPIIYARMFISLKGLFTNFEYITFFSCPTERNIFYKRFISIKPLWLEIIEKKGCTKSVRVIYMIYITVLGRTDFVHPIFSIISSQSGLIEMNLL